MMKESLSKTVALVETLVGKENIVLSFSHQNEDVVLIDILQKAGVKFDIFTLDTEKLFDESIQYESYIEYRFGLKIARYKASPEEIEALEAKVGEFGIFESVDLRKECCRVRKLLPLKEALGGKEIWVTGIRASQSVTRNNIVFNEFDENFKILKMNPLVEWSRDEILEYLDLNDIKQNSLYAKGYTSIGCYPCTRPIEPGEDERAGRWWWENPEHKECGLHRRDR